MTPRNQFLASVTGTLLVAIYCFTPLLVVALAGIGLAAFTRYLDIVLFPALAILIVVSLISYRRYARAADRR